MWCQPHSLHRDNPYSLPRAGELGCGGTRLGHSPLLPPPVLFSRVFLYVFPLLSGDIHAGSPLLQPGG